jgi:hypothetical protein
MLKNPELKNAEYLNLIQVYKDSLMKYQPAKYYFGHIDRGVKVDWETNVESYLTLEELKDKIKRVLPIGPKTNIDNIVEVKIKNDYMKEIDDIVNDPTIFYYAKEKEDFFIWQGYQQASELGYSKIFFDNLS